MIGLIVLCGVVAYANSLNGPFIFDDSSSILDNPTIKDPGDLGAVFRPPHETPVAGRPLVNLTFAANVAAGGFNVTGFHAVNIAIHIACALLLLGVARRAWAGGAGFPAAVALVWLVHPLNTEAVNYITQRTELLMALFLMLALYASIRDWKALSVCACALGMLSKESMVVAPILIVAYDRVFVFSSSSPWKDAWKARGRFYLALAATWLVLAWLVSGGGRSESAGFSAFDANAWQYLLNQTQIIARYLRLAIVPVGLAIDYGLPRPLTLVDVWPYALGLVLLATLTIVALVRHARLGFLGLWFFVTLAPASSILPIATEVGAERRMYLPLMALVCLIAALLIAASKRFATEDRRAAAAPAIAVAAIVIALTPMTWARNAEYRSALVLTETTVERYPTGAALSMYGTELAAAGRLMEAEVQLRRGTPTYPPAHFYLATVLQARGDLAGALREFEEFIRLQPPELTQVQTARVMSADILGRMASDLVRQSRYPEAIAMYQRSLKMTPDDPAALNGLGVALISAGRVDEAIAAFQRVVDLAPDRPGARENLARALAMRGK